MHFFPRMSFILLPVKLMMRCAGCDCLGSIHYFDALMANSKGELLISLNTLSSSVSRIHITLRMQPETLQPNWRLPSSLHQAVDGLQHNLCCSDDALCYMHAAAFAGEPFEIKKAVCLHEEDAGMIWKHTELRTMHPEVRRGRRLVISTVATVGTPHSSAAYSAVEIQLSMCSGSCASCASKCSRRTVPAGALSSATVDRPIPHHPCSRKAKSFPLWLCNDTYAPRVLWAQSLSECYLLPWSRQQSNLTQRSASKPVTTNPSSK